MKIMVIREGLLQSIMSDLITFGFTLFSIWFSYNFCGNSYFLNSLSVIIILLFSLSRLQSKGTVFYSEKELIEHLKKIEGEI